MNIYLRTAKDWQQLQNAIIDSFDEQTHINFAQAQALDTLRQTLNACLDRIEALENELEDLKEK